MQKLALNINYSDSETRVTYYEEGKKTTPDARESETK